MDQMDMLYNVKDFKFLLPLEHTIWYPNVTFTACHTYYVLLTVIFLAIPTNIADFFLDLFKIKTQVRLSKIVRKIFYVQESLNFFMQTQFTFNNKKCLGLTENLSKSDQVKFCLDPQISREDYIYSCLINARKYLMHEDMSNVTRAQKKMYALCVLHYLLLALIYGTLAFAVFSFIKSGHYLDTFIN